MHECLRVDFESLSGYATETNRRSHETPQVPLLFCSLTHRLSLFLISLHLFLQVKLSLATGIYQSLPKWLSPWITEWTPAWCLAYQIDSIGRSIVQDDSLLLEERHDITRCQTLTDIEVLDACLIRGLPIMNHSTNERRQCLTNHLKLIASVKQRLLIRQQQQQQHDRNIFQTDGFRLFTLHLNPLRYHLKKTQQHSLGTSTKK